jgi:SAM-dependent methyltransferase
VALRRKRVELFLEFIRDLPPPIRVLDVGGTERFWVTVGLPDGLSIMLLNRTAAPVETPGIESVAGDARHLGAFEDGAFDVVFSNSVIEHVGSFADQARMAAEVQRVGRRYFVQTPNRYFPIEPHFLFPGFQFLPRRIRAGLHQRFDLGWMKRAEDHSSALRNVDELRLLTRAELETLFPRARIWVERFWGWPKSYVAFGHSDGHTNA